jgi:hypothetical protein
MDVLMSREHTDVRSDAYTLVSEHYEETFNTILSSAIVLIGGIKKARVFTPGLLSIDELDYCLIPGALILIPLLI